MLQLFRVALILLGRMLLIINFKHVRLGIECLDTNDPALKKMKQNKKLPPGIYPIVSVLYCTVTETRINLSRTANPP